MALTKITSAIIADGAITASAITDTSITAAKLHTTLDLTGKAVTVATATAGDNDTTVASTAFVSTAIANLADSAPSTLDTLNELAAALGDDANYATTTTNAIAAKLPLAGGTMTGALAMNTNAITSTGDLTLDAAGNIILDADGGDVNFFDGGTETLRYSSSGAGPQFFSPVVDKDIIFKGKDGSSTITALTLDMSEAGAATFNSTVISPLIDATIVDGENFKINGAQGTDGQLLTSTGSGVAWEDAPASGPSKGLAIVLSMIF